MKYNDVSTQLTEFSLIKVTRKTLKHWCKVSKVAVLKKFEEEKIDNTVKLCLSILTCYNAITRVNKPSYHTPCLKYKNLLLELVAEGNIYFSGA